ncbi:hypothetical protein F400_gp127 [Bacillus phage BCD7]|uniref:Uncharacterized protein n=1 Tax=Bacillus phage BCD7 TaxID=1136534 RepID=J9PVB1_9CAUD|nr:hypothetical protein F400_gp127 [Bacillus phage BCD7]AEZ50574.1 hypothetical protein BCD7_0127 [Bacillus phage BCD7]
MNKYKNCVVPPPTKEGKEEFRKQFMEMATKDLLPYQKKLLEMHMKQQVSPYTIMGRRVGRLR